MSDMGEYLRLAEHARQTLLAKISGFGTASNHTRAQADLDAYVEKALADNERLRADRDALCDAYEAVANKPWWSAIPDSNAEPRTPTERTS